MISLAEQKKNRILLASEKQRKAANPNKSVWVEASAGTGKTKVLSDRVLRLLLEGCNPAKILCLTYTKAAAVEMNTRIAGRLSRWAVASDDQLYEELESLLGRKISPCEKDDELLAMARKLFAVLLDTPGGMKIQTIHSFCQEILKRFPLEAKISPYFEVMDDRTANEALDEIKKKLLGKIEREPDSLVGKSLAYITQNVSESIFPKIMGSLTANRSKIARMLDKYGSVEELFSRIAEKLDVCENDTFDSVVRDYWQECDKDELKKIMHALFSGSPSDMSRAETLALILEEGLNRENLSLFEKIYLTEGKIRSRLATKEAVKVYPEIANKMVAIGISLQELENKLSSVGLFEATRAVLYLAEDLISGYNAYKRLHSKMDYEDLIVLTRELLEDRDVADWVLFKLDGGIDNVLIDEAQDTSPDQWAIIRAITEDFFNGESVKKQIRTIFAVGDRKQSIYSFQGADPREFENMRQYFSSRCKGVKDFEEVQLDVSFRSSAAILDMVNSVFSTEYAKRGVIPIEQDMTHVPSKIGDGGKVEIWPIIEAEENEKQEVWRPPVERRMSESPLVRLARKIALQIKKLVEDKDILLSQNRPVRYSDFMILVNRRKDIVDALVRECKNVGVNVAGADRIKLSEQIVVQDLIALARFLLLPSDDLTLAVILKSPLFGLNDDDLFKLCYNRGNASLWSNLGKFPEYSLIYEQLQNLLNLVDFVRPFELYSYVLNKMDGRKKFLSRLGFEVVDGIDEFINLTLNFEQEHNPNLQAFVDWVEKDDAEIKREQEQSNIDAVRIMTVHGSKGLQAPIVILPDAVRVKRPKNETGLLWDDDVFYYPFSSDHYESNCKKIKDKEKEDALEEYRRLLYVALTRAEDRLCICGYTKSREPSEDSWYALCLQSLAKIGVEKAEGEFCYDVAQLLEKERKKEQTKVENVVGFYDWVKSFPKEEGALSKPLTPSKQENDDEVWASPLGKNEQNCYRRGKFIHKLLQFLPEIKKAEHQSVIEEFFVKNVPDITDNERKKVSKEIIRLFEDSDFSAVFGDNSRAEVPVMGMVDGRIISGQIDRLVVEENRVMIIDFKTNRPAAKCVEDIPIAYVKQLDAYKKLVERIYPNHQVETYILWTDTANLMKVNS